MLYRKAKNPKQAVRDLISRAFKAEALTKYFLISEGRKNFAVNTFFLFSCLPGYLHNFAAVHRSSLRKIHSAMGL